MPEEVHGQLQIHQKIMELAFNDCKAKILLVDAHRTLENGVVVQVTTRYGILLTYHWTLVLYAGIW